MLESVLLGHTLLAYPKYVKQRCSLALFLNVKVLLFTGMPMSSSSNPLPLCPTRFGGLHIGKLLNNFNTIALCLAHIYVFGCLRGGIILGRTV